MDWWTCPAKSNSAYVSVIAKAPFNVATPWQLGIAEWDIGGYTPINGYFHTKAEADYEAKMRNAQVGLSESEALSIVLSSMRAPNGRERRKG